MFKALTRSSGGDVKRNVRSTLDKLRGIKADLEKLGLQRSLEGTKEMDGYQPCPRNNGRQEPGLSDFRTDSAHAGLRNLFTNESHEPGTRNACFMKNQITER